MRKLFATLPLILLTGCGSITVPASGVTSAGETFEGSSTASLSGGTFNVQSVAGVTCSGTYNPLDAAKRFSVPFTCSDGRTGVIDVVRDNDGMSGQGSATFSDGTTGTFQFGEA